MSWLRLLLITLTFVSFTHNIKAQPLNNQSSVTPEIAAAIEAALKARYDDSVTSLASEKRSFEWTVWIFSTLVSLLAVAAVVLAYRFGQSLDGLQQRIRDDAERTFLNEIFQTKKR